MNDELTNRLKAEGRALGFSMIGVIPAAPGRRLDAYLRWLASGYNGEMGYLARPDRTSRRTDLNVILPDVQSLVCVGLDYYPGQLPSDVISDPSRGRISSYAWGQDYHDVMTPRLAELASWLEKNSGAPTSSKVYVDTGAILERDHAESAGFGFTGKNTMLISPRVGSWFFLGELLTSARLLPDTMNSSMPNCGRCSRCLDACPTDAFPSPYILDARRCISYLTIELKGWIPRALRPMMGNWIYGCDICQVVCPFNRFAKPVDESAFKAESLDRAAPRLIEILSLDDDGFQERFKGSPIRRIKRDRLVRNACVAAGNWGDQEAAPALIELLTDQSPLVRGHAAWALLKIGGADIERAIAAALRYEPEPTVRQEMAASDL